MLPSPTIDFVCERMVEHDGYVHPGGPASSWSAFSGHPLVTTRNSYKYPSGEAALGILDTPRDIQPTSDSAHEVGAILKSRREARSAQLSERGTDVMVAGATSDKVEIASSDGRRFARSRRRRCRCAHFHHMMWRHLVKYSLARV